MTQDVEAMKAELERLKAENSALKSSAPKPKEISMKVSPKGGLSVYGMGRFPVTLYKEQWIRLKEKKEDILSFIDEHDSELATKD